VKDSDALSQCEDITIAASDLSKAASAVVFRRGASKDAVKLRS